MEGVNGSYTILNKKIMFLSTAFGTRRLEAHTQCVSVGDHSSKLSAEPHADRARWKRDPKECVPVLANVWAKEWERDAEELEGA